MAEVFTRPNKELGMNQTPEELFAMVKEAAGRLRGVAHVTPVMTSRTLNERLNAEVFLKCENFQRIGAFKFRGAYNAMSRLSAAERARGVLTFSSGNHAQAVALTGRLLGIKTTVVMPCDAPVIKRDATQAYGATVISYDPQERSREEIARELQQQQGFTLIPPYDHLDVVAGQGTAALELGEQSGRLDMLLVPCGGGGLLSGKYRRNAPLPPGARLTETRRSADRFLTGRNWSIAEQLEAFCGERDHGLLELAFSWLASRPMVASVIAGATTPEQIDANVHAAGWRLTADELAAVDRITGAAAAG